MARNKVDMPEPGGAGDQSRRACLDRQPVDTYDFAPIRQTRYKVTQYQIAPVMLGALDARHSAGRVAQHDAPLAVH
jgi:hypothetical protein